MIQAPKGTKDVLPEDSFIWQYVENKFAKTCNLFGFQEVRFPTFEYTELFERGVGDTTDIVQKEMYTFQDKGGRSITLRPEGTASTARMFIEHGFTSRPMPQKLYYMISAFRYENTQGGRYREFHQFGIEVFGSFSPLTDFVVISLAHNYFKSLGLNVKVNINNIGCPECRKDYYQKLKSYFTDYKDKLCSTCLERLERNPMRILDCKEKQCKLISNNAPKPIDNVCDDCKTHFELLEDYLKCSKIEYRVDPWIVRGLDYYTKTVFEIVDIVDGKELAICGGGRYDNLIDQIGGGKIPGIGFAIGVERLILLLKDKNLLPERKPQLDAYIITMGQEAIKKSIELTDKLRASNIRVAFEEMGRSIKAQMKYANKLSVRYVLIIGEDEIKTGKVKLKDMLNSQEFEIDIDKIDEYLTKQIL